MTIPKQLEYTGSNKEFQFRDEFVMPLLVQLGFGIVANYHGSREFGRDLIFGDVDRFGHVVYYGMQIKYEASISLSQSHELIQDAEQATHNPFRHPQTGRDEFISCFYVANAGDISDQARVNFFGTLPRRGIRDARLLDGNALVLLNKSAAINRTANIRERLSGMLQELARNHGVTADLIAKMQTFLTDPATQPFPMIRLRNCATGAYLSAPFPIGALRVDVVDQYWELTRMANDVADSIQLTGANEEFRKIRFAGLQKILADASEREKVVAKTVADVLLELATSVKP